MSVVCIRETGMLDQWADSMAAAYFNGYIHLVGQATHAITPTNDHHIFSTDGTRIAKFSGDFTSRGEASLSLIAANKLTLVGGTTRNDVWQFDPAIAGNTAASWTQINESYEAAIGQRIMAMGIDAGGWFFIIGGWNRDTIYKTQNFIDWTLVATMPDEMKKISAFGCCVFNGLIYCVGGSTNMATGSSTEFYASEVNGRIFTLDPADGTIEEIYQNQELFGQIWLDAVATDDYIYVMKGYIHPAMSDEFPPESNAAIGHNNRGLFRSADGVTWESLSTTDGNAFLFERHRAGVVTVDNIAYIIGGYNANGMWKIVEN